MSRTDLVRTQAPTAGPRPAPLQQPRVVRRLLAMLAVLAIAASACGGGGGEAPDLASAPIADQISALHASASYGQPMYSSPLETTPLTSFVVDGQAAGQVSDLFVVGTVRAVSAGSGYSWPGGPQIEGEASTRVVHDFNSKEASISTVHLSVAVEKALYTDERFAGREEVTIGLALLSPVSIESLRSELEGSTIAAPLLANERTVFDLEGDVFGVLRDGQLLGFVDAAGKVSFPASDLERFFDSGSVQESGSISLDDLLDPPALVRLQTVDGTLEPES